MASEEHGEARRALVSAQRLTAIGELGLRLQRIIWRLRSHAYGQATDTSGG